MIGADQSAPDRFSSLAGKLRARLAHAEGSQIVEFAFALPFLLVFIIGVTDMGGAFLTRQRLAASAGEGARYAIAQSMDDLTQAGTPQTITNVRDTITNYMKNKANMNTCGLDTASPSGSSSTMTWTYSSTGTCSAAATLVINRADLVSSSSSFAGNGITFDAVSTQITITYPYKWSLNGIIKMLPGKSAASPVFPATLTVQITMKNQS